MPDLIGHSATEELVREVSLVFGGRIILDPVVINAPQYMSQKKSIPGCMRQSTDRC